jgi:hypothetical protein
MTQATDTHAELMALAKEASLKKAAALKRDAKGGDEYYHDSRHAVYAARWDGMAKAYRKAAAMLKTAQEDDQ